MRRVLLLLGLFAVVVGAVAVALFLGRPTERTVPEIPIVVKEAREAPSVERPSADLPRGGVYAGIVQDAKGVPIPGATVLLVAFETGQHAGPGVVGTSPSAEGFDFSQVARIGHETAAEGKADAEGRFRVAADADSAIRIVAAYRQGYMPDLFAVTGPREDLVLTLEEAGQFVGHVVDAETKRPVPGARVTIYLQQRALKPTSAPGSFEGGAPESVALSPFAIAQRWVVEALGQRVWGLTSSGEPGFDVLTDADGDFRFGPVGDKVQLEFVVTHPDYMWTDFDTQPDGETVRTVVRPGETVERTFALVKGHSITGRVVDAEDDKGVADVLVEIEHVNQSLQHWWYRVKKRTTRSGKDGRFRVGGLSDGPYVATLRPPTGGVEFIPGIPEDAKDVVWEIKHRGALRGRIDGLVQPKGTEVAVILETPTQDTSEGRHSVFRAALDADARFTVPDLLPGWYEVWVQAAGQSSIPKRVRVEAHQTEPVVFELGGGGGLALRVLDSRGRVVDPAQVQLVRVEGDADGPTLGSFVTRRGRLDAQAIAPGRYRLRVVATEFVPYASEPFEIVDAKTTDLGAIQLLQRAWLRIKEVVVADRPGTAVGVVSISLREGEKGDFRPLPPLTGHPVAIRPGSITVRAESSKGLSYEETFQVAEGETLPVAVELR